MCTSITVVGQSLYTESGGILATEPFGFELDQADCDRLQFDQEVLAILWKRIPPVSDLVWQLLSLAVRSSSAGRIDVQEAVSIW